MTSTHHLVLNGAMLRIPIDQVQPGPNVRGEDVGDVTELAVSIAAIGQQEPIIVAQATEGQYEIIEGHRRRKAILLAGIPHVDAVLRRRPGDGERIIRQLAMHTHAKAFDPVAEARAMDELLWKYKLSREQIAAKIGRPPGWVRDRLALLQLTKQEQQAVTSGDLPLWEAATIVRARRAQRDGRPAPTPRSAQPAPARQRRQVPERHLNKAHPLAHLALERCRSGGTEHLNRLLIGEVACGECWERVIRNDQTTKDNVLPHLAGQPTTSAAMPTGSKRVPVEVGR